jgi:hypothetical protein
VTITRQSFLRASTMNLASALGASTLPSARDCSQSTLTSSMAPASTALQRAAVAKSPGADDIGAVRALVLEGAGEHEGDGHRGDADDDDEDEGRRPPPARTPARRPASRTVAAVSFSSASRHVLIMTPDRPPVKPAPRVAPTGAGCPRDRR